MTEHERNQICPETVISILLPANQIPHGSVVRKKGGSYDYRLSHKLRVFVPKEDTSMTAQDVAGFFLQPIQPNAADVNQIQGDKVLQWRIAAEDFKDYLERLWEPTPQ